MFFAGLEGQPVDVFEYYEDTGVDGYNLIASIGAFILVIGILLELGNAAYSWNNGLPARGHDPWGGSTLEWFALSPPPPHNFDAVPDVRSARAAARHPRVGRAASAALRAAGARSSRVEPDRRRGARAGAARPESAGGLRRRRERPGSLTAMSAVAARGDADELSRFRRLVTYTIAATFVLILIGGIVRVSDSGLGCGAGGQRHARLAAVRGRRPARRLGRVGDRVLATGSPPRSSTVLIALLAWQALRRLREHRLLVRGSIAAGVLVLAQAALGGLTVEQGLEDELVAAHLGLAMLLLGLLFVLRRGAEPTPGAARRESVRGLRAADRRRRRRSCWRRSSPAATSPAPSTTAPPNQPLAGAHSACGTGWSADQFPGCNGQGALSLRPVAPRRHPAHPPRCSCTWPRSRCSRWRRWRCAGARPSRAFWIAPLLLLGQIALGAINVWAGKHAGPDRRPPGARDDALGDGRLRRPRP